MFPFTYLFSQKVVGTKYNGENCFNSEDTFTKDGPRDLHFYFNFQGDQSSVRRKFFTRLEEKHKEMGDPPFSMGRQRDR